MRGEWLGCIAGVFALALMLTGAGRVEADDDRRVKRAVESIQRAQDASGLLLYDFDFLAGAPSGQNDAVRQAGVIAFLAEYLVASGDASVKPTLIRALERFDALSLPIGKSRLQKAVEASGLLSVPRGLHKLASVLDRLGLLYKPVGDGAVLGLEPEYAQMSAGATALALLAELQYADASGDGRFEAARARWLRGLAALHVAGHGFRVTPTKIHVSPFADGEGWLALAYYERRRPGDPTVRSILTALEDSLIRQYGASFSISFYQWGTMAAAVRWSTTRDARFAAFIEQQTVSAMKWLSEPRAHNTCATVEGLATAACVLHDAGRPSDLLKSIDQHVTTEMRKNYEFQIPPNTGRFNLGNGASVVSPRLEEFAGAFFHERYRPYTRIDFTGHCLSAMVKLRREKWSG
jgi:hypothetical protein